MRKDVWVPRDRRRSDGRVRIKGKVNDKTGIRVSVLAEGQTGSQSLVFTQDGQMLV